MGGRRLGTGCFAVTCHGPRPLVFRRFGAWRWACGWGRVSAWHTAQRTASLGFCSGFAASNSRSVGRGECSNLFEIYIIHNIVCIKVTQKCGVPKLWMFEKPQFFSQNVVIIISYFSGRRFVIFFLILGPQNGFIHFARYCNSSPNLWACQIEALKKVHVPQNLLELPVFAYTSDNTHGVLLCHCGDLKF